MPRPAQHTRPAQHRGDTLRGARGPKAAVSCLPLPTLRGRDTMRRRGPNRRRSYCRPRCPSRRRCHRARPDRRRPHPGLRTRLRQRRDDPRLGHRGEREAAGEAHAERRHVKRRLRPEVSIQTAREGSVSAHNCGHSNERNPQPAMLTAAIRNGRNTSTPAVREASSASFDMIGFGWLRERKARPPDDSANSIVRTARQRSRPPCASIVSSRSSRGDMAFSFGRQFIVIPGRPEA